MSTIAWHKVKAYSGKLLCGDVCAGNEHYRDRITGAQNLTIERSQESAMNAFRTYVLTE